MAKVGAGLCAIPVLKSVREIAEQKQTPKFPLLPIPAFSPFGFKGLCRGSIARVFGMRSSGRSAVSLHILAQATQAGEVCAVVDFSNGFAPGAAMEAGVRLERLFWVRCRKNAEHAMQATDWLLHAGGFGVVLLDLCEATSRVTNRIPLSYWFRFQRAVENTPTILLVCGDQAHAQACAATTMELAPGGFCWSGLPPFLLLRGIEITATFSNGSAWPRTAALKSVA